MRKLINISLWVVGALVILLLLIVVNKAQSNQSLRSIEVTVDKGATNRFIDENEIKEVITNLGYTAENVAMPGVDIGHIEGLLKNNPSIKNAEVYQRIDGSMEVEVEQREPIIRIFNNNNTSYYLDKSGNLMPLSNKYTARVLIASGNIDIPYSSVYQLSQLHTQQRNRKPFEQSSAMHNTTLAEELQLADTLRGFKQLKEIYALAEHINSDEFWSAQINQIFVDSVGHYILIPRVGNHEINFGYAEDMTEKFEKLMIFYQEGLQKTGWNEYENIDLRFKNQVVCTKK